MGADCFELADEVATIACGREIAERLKSGDCMVLIGGLGAGKTHLTKGIVAGLGSEEDVTSPTFSLVQEYVKGRLPVFHFDFYRMESPEEVLAIGWDEYLDADGVVIVEWGNKFPELIPESATWWALEESESGGRTLRKAVVKR